MTSSRCGVRVGVVRDNIYAVGGWDGQSTLSSGEKYDQDEDEWTPVTSMPTARCRAGVGVISDKIYVVGGRDRPSGSILKVVECYDVKTDSWSTLRDMNVGRSSAAVVVGNSYLYVIGGCGEGDSHLSSMEVYDPDNNTWTLLPSSSNMSSGRNSMGAAMIDLSV